MHAGTIDPPKEGATSTVLGASTMAKVVVDVSDNRLEWKNSVGLNQGGKVVGDGVGRLENIDNSNGNRGYLHDFAGKFWRRQLLKVVELLSELVTSHKRNLLDVMEWSKKVWVNRKSAQIC